MLLKLGVDISRLDRRVRRKLSAIDRVFLKHLGIEAVITSTHEGNHSAASLHYCNLAIDIRLPKDKLTDIYRDLVFVIGKNFDAVVENGHIHIEYDPK